MEEEQMKHLSNDSAPMAGMLNALLSNPELLQKIGTMVSAMQSSAVGGASAIAQADQAIPTQADQTVPSQEPTEPTAAKTPSVPSDGLATLLSDPSMLEKLPQIIAVMKPLMASDPPSVPAAKVEKPSPALCRDNLLCALKPFLSPERRDAVDSIMRIAKLSAVFQQLK